jgi:peptidyl-prolyl cis-trans isomerase C
MLLLAFGLTACASNATLDPVMAVRVNGHGSTLSEYQTVLRYASANYAAQGRLPDWQSPSGRTDLSGLEQSAVDFLINLQLVQNELQKQKIRVTPAQRADARQQIESSLAQSPALRDAATPDMKAMLVQYVAGRNALGAQGVFPSAHLRVIVVNSEADAQNLLKQAQAGADFGKLSHDHSVIQSIADQSGDLGTVYPGQINAPALDSAIFGPHPNPEKLFIVPVDQQWVVAEVTDVKPMQIKGDQNMQSQVVSGWLATTARSSAHIEQYVTTS